MSEEEDKLLDWAIVKEKLSKSNSTPKIRTGDVWWCACGKNLGREINGKNKQFSRPVAIYRKLDDYSFLGVPLTSQQKTGSWYASFDFSGRKQTAVLSQVRVFSVLRLYSKMGQLSKADLIKIKKAFLRLYG